MYLFNLFPFIPDFVAWVCVIAALDHVHRIHAHHAELENSKIIINPSLLLAT